MVAGACHPSSRRQGQKDLAEVVAFRLSERLHLHHSESDGEIHLTSTLGFATHGHMCMWGGAHMHIQVDTYMHI